MYPYRPRDDIGAYTDADAGTHRATHSMMLMCFPALAASISRESTISGVNAGTVTFTDATDTGTDTGTYRHTVVLAIVELGAWRAQVQV